MNTKSWLHYLIITDVYGIFSGAIPYAMQLSECGWSTFYIMANSCERHILKHRLKTIIALNV